MAIKNIDALAKFVKGGADVLQKALSSDEELELELNDGSFVSDAELEAMKQTRFEDGKKEGNKIGYDFAMKDIKKDFGIEIEGKDRQKIVEAINSKIISDAKIEPDKKVNELKISLENLQKQYTSDIESKTSEINALTGKLTDFKINSDLSHHIPEGLNGIDKNDFMTLAKTKASFIYDGDQLVVKQGENILKDKLERPISPKDFLTSFATEKNWIKTDGRGGGDNKGGGEFKTINDVYKHMEQNNINPMSPDGVKLIESFKSQN